MLLYLNFIVSTEIKDDLVVMISKIYWLIRCIIKLYMDEL